MAKKVTQTKATLLREMNAKINELYSKAFKEKNIPRQKKIVEEITTLTKLRDQLTNSK